MAKYVVCIFCDSLDVSETVVGGKNEEPSFEYYCHECGETWADDESEYEIGV